MKRRTLVKLAAVMVLGLPCLGPLPEAQACSGWQMGNLASRLVFPADGTSSVPTNAQVVVSYLSAGDSRPVVDHLALKTASGESVPVTVSQPITDTSGYLKHKSFVLVPSVPLKPNTKYQLFSDIATLPCIQNEVWTNSTPSTPCRSIVDGGVADNGAAAVSTPVASFTTGSDPDNTPPTLSGAITYASEAQSCTSSPCCGPYEGYSVPLRWEAAADGGARLFYELSREGVVILYPIQTGDGNVAGNGVRGAFLCSGGKYTSTVGSFGYEEFQAQPGNFQVVAVDMAGNRSSRVSVDVTVDCPALDGGASAVDAVRVEVTSAADARNVLPDGLDVVENDADVVKRDAASLSDQASDPRTTADSMAATNLPVWPEDTASTVPDAGAPDVAVAVQPDLAPANHEVKPASADANKAGADAAIAERSNSGSGCSCRMGGHGSGLAGFVVVALVLAVRRRRYRASTN